MSMSNTTKMQSQSDHLEQNNNNPSAVELNIISSSDHLEPNNNNPSAVELNIINSSDHLEPNTKNNQPAQQLNNNNPFPPNHHNSSNQFTFHIVMAVCMALLSAQLENESVTQLSLYVLSLLILLVFLCVLVANLIRNTPFVYTARVLEKVAVFLASVAVVFTIAIPLPVPLKCFTWFLYLVALFSVLFCSFT